MKRPHITGRRTPAVIGILGLITITSCHPVPNAPPSHNSTESVVQFVEISEKAGIHFQHNNGAAGKKYIPETFGSGCAFFDFDNDGWQDLLVINSCNWPADSNSPKSRHDTLHLYHNNRNGTFTDVTMEAGLAIEFYGTGVCVGDS